MPTTSNAPSFPMGAPNMPQHPPGQRMQPPLPTSAPTPSSGLQRASPYGVPHGTPPNSASGQSQFSTPQNPNQTHIQTQNIGQQSHSAGVITPQTPNFPPGSQGGGNNLATPLSPGSEFREKERVTLLLDINRELLLEVMRLQATQKEQAAIANSPEASGEKEPAEKEKIDKEKALTGKEYFE